MRLLLLVGIRGNARVGPLAAPGKLAVDKVLELANL
jgi:hypothetical protein